MDLVRSVSIYGCQYYPVATTFSNRKVSTVSLFKRNIFDCKKHIFLFFACHWPKHPTTQYHDDSQNLLLLFENCNSLLILTNFNWNFFWQLEREFHCITLKELQSYWTTKSSCNFVFELQFTNDLGNRRLQYW